MALECPLTLYQNLSIYLLSLRGRQTFANRFYTVKCRRLNQIEIKIETNLLQENAFVFGRCKCGIVPGNEDLSHEWLTVTRHLSNHGPVSWNRSPIENLCVMIWRNLLFVFLMLLIKRKPEESTPWQFPGTWLRSRRDSPGLQNRCPWRNGLLAVIRYQLLPCSDINKAITI